MIVQLSEFALLLHEFLQRNKMKKIFIVDSDMYHNILWAKEVVNVAGYFELIKRPLVLGYFLPIIFLKYSTGPIHNSN